MAPSWLTVLDDTIGACITHRRPDLAHRLQRQRARLLDPQLRVLVMGGPNQGKSQLINAIVNAPVCAVGDDVTTAAQTVVQHADAPSAALVTVSGLPARRAITGPPAPSGPTERVPVPIEEVSRQVTKQAGAGGADVVRAEIGIPRKLLAAGLVLIDTPAIGSACLDSPTAQTHRTMAGLEQADAVLFVTAATAELSGAELDLLGRIHAVCPNIVVVVSKIDLVPRWRQVAERDRAKLVENRLPAMVVPVSAALRQTAATSGDTTINAESGFPALLELLQRQVVGKADVIAPRLAGAACADTVSVLADGLRAAAQAANDVPDVSHELADAQRAMDELRRRTARCQTLLGDHIADLTSDIEHDLRDRTRRILREVDKTFDDSDPKTVWDDFGRWLTDNLAEAAEANSGWLIERCQWVADRVVATFPALEPDGPTAALTSGHPDPLDDMDELEEPRLEPFGVGQKVFTGLRGSYGGVLMFGLITSLAGLPLINPISLSAGAAFGGKSIKDESDARLKRRQAAARASAQRYVDDFFLKCGKETRDLTRRVQRTLRDHITDRAEELAERISEATRLARQHAHMAAVQRDEQLRHAQQEMTVLAELRRKALLLAGPVSVPAARAPQAVAATRAAGITA
jgi:hypothetical protein